MAQAHYDFGWAQALRADAVGRPGQRRFRLLIESKAGSCCLWLEKEQLLSLAMAVKRLLAQLPKEAQPERAEQGAHRPGDTRLEFRVGEMVVEHDQGTGAISLTAREARGDRQKGTAFSCRAGKGQLEALSEEALKVCAAGRPLCPLCYAPVEAQPHVCPKSNGHVRQWPREEGDARA